MPDRTYTCEGCGAQFTGTAEQAFQLGWDTPERFMSHCTCPECPISCTVWWKLMVLKQAPTMADLELIHDYNEIFEEAS